MSSIVNKKYFKFNFCWSCSLVSLDKPRDVTHSLVNADESDSKHEEQNKDYASGDSVKPLFLVGKDVFGSTKPDRTHWLTNVEIYKAVGSKVPAECIKGIQRIRDMWRIYMDNTEDRITLIVEGLNLRGRLVPLPQYLPI
jgi:hypothetical protein